MSSQGAGRIIAGGRSVEVIVTVADAPLTDAIHVAYRVTYVDSQYPPPLVSQRTQAATLAIHLRV